MMRRHGSTALVAVTLITCLVIAGSFYLVGSGTAVADVIALAGTFGAMVTGLITLLIKQDNQGEQLKEIRANTNHLMETAITDAVSEGVTDAAQAAARLRKEEDPRPRDPYT